MRRTMVLLSRTQGWSAEELAYELYGDVGTPEAIRTEMFRVRSMLGDAVESNPCRLAAGLGGCPDSGRVLRLMREGRVADALEAHRAPLLSRSSALAVRPGNGISRAVQGRRRAPRAVADHGYGFGGFLRQWRWLGPR